MQGDFSRRTFDRKKHYCGVLMQQGRVQVDADWNEQVLLEDYLRTTQAQDVIGLVGAPKHAGGFRVGRTPDQQDLTLSPGRLYVEGMLCEIIPQPIPVLEVATGKLKVTHLGVEGRELKEGQWLSLLAPSGQLVKLIKVSHIDAKESTLDFEPHLNVSELAALPAGSKAQPLITYFTQPWLQDPEVPDKGRYLVYLDVWRRHVSATEDPAIREVALGGPDTATRMQTVWQVKLFRLDEDDPFECAHFPPGWRPQAPSAARLEARTAPVPEVTDPCLLPPGSGYLGLQNQLYRVEVHHPGNLQEATFKWSRDNGSVVTAVKRISGQVMEVQDLGRSHSLGFAVGDWVEYLDDRLEMQAGCGILLRIADIDPAKNTITFPTGFFLPISCDPELHPRLRRWDQPKGSPAEGLPITDGWLPLEHGLEVRFSGKSFRSGDYWLIPARTASKYGRAHIEWPFDERTGTPLAQPPLGIEHAYCPLALVQYDGRVFTPSQPPDCRRIFPPLIEVSEAAAGQVCCTFTVGNGKDSHGDYNDLQAALDDLPAAGGRICLLPGEHRGNYRIQKKRNLIISGCPWRTTVLPAVGEPAGPVFTLEECRRVVLENLDIINLGGTAIQGGTKLADLEIRANRILAGTHAIEVAWGRNVVIRDNRIRLIDSPTAGVAIFLGGEHGRIENNNIVVLPARREQKEITVTDDRRFPNPSHECTEVFTLYRHREFYAYVNYAMEFHYIGGLLPVTEIFRTSGGIQIAGGSGDIRIVGNEITGGAWNGITLGHRPDVRPARNQGVVRPVGTYNMPYEQKTALQSQFNGLLHNIAILDNDIHGAGLNGIGVVSFFSLKEMGLMVSVQGLSIANNRISNCLRQLSEYLTDDLWSLMHRDMGFGGISLADCEDLVIRENLIADNGIRQEYPVCGIFLLQAEKVDISDNRILNNGPSPTSTATGTLRRGWRGGIVITLSFKEWRQELREYLQEQDFPLPEGIPAAKIHHNVVTQPVGQALSLIAYGPVSIVGNHLTSLAIDASSPRALLAGTVSLLNLGISKDLVGALILSHGYMPRSLKTGLVVAVTPDRSALEALLHLPSGQVLFTDNQVSLNLLSAGPEGCLSSQLLASYDDVSYVGNQSECAGLGDIVFIDAGIMGTTVRTCNNRFQSGFTGMLYSLVSFGFMNTTMGNQATHCLIPLGLPQFVQTTANAVFVGTNCPADQKQLENHYLAIRK